MNNTEAPAVPDSDGRQVRIPKKAKKNKKAAAVKPKKLRYRPLKPRRKFALQPNFYIFCAVWVFCLIFTQALRSPLSSVMLLFVTFLPYICLAYVFIARSALHIRIENSAAETIKGEPVSFNVIVENEKLIPLPFVEADLLIPNETSVRSVEQRVYLSIAPSSRYEINKTVTFNYRGQYDIGVSNLYCYDFFRFFRLKLEEHQYNPIFVLPRRYVLAVNAENAASDVNTESSKNVRGIDRAEMSSIRQYRMGDHMKTVHWKLSSKTQDLQVKEYAMNSGKTVYIFLDLARHFNTDTDDDIYDDDINEYAIDGVIELALAAALREVKSGNTCNLIWYDARVPGGTQICHIESPEDLDRGFKSFATAELCPKDKEMTKLVALISETQGVSVLFVTSELNSRLVDGMSEASSLFNNVSSQGAVELYYFNPEERIYSAKVRDRHHEVAESCKLQLLASGIKAAEIKPS